MAETRSAVAADWHRTGLLRSSDRMPTGSAAQAMSPAAAITTRDGSRTGCAPWKNTVGEVAGARDVCATVGGAGLGSPRQPVDMVMTTTDVVPTARTRRV